MKIHIPCIAIKPVRNDPAFMLHSKIFYLMPHLLKLFPDFKNIGFRSAVRMQKFIDNQYFHF